MAARTEPDSIPAVVMPGVHTPDPSPHTTTIDSAGVAYQVEARMPRGETPVRAIASRAAILLDTYRPILLSCPGQPRARFRSTWSFGPCKAWKVLDLQQARGVLAAGDPGASAQPDDLRDDDVGCGEQD
jgi:hypothetical protein